VLWSCRHDSQLELVSSIFGIVSAMNDSTTSFVQACSFVFTTRSLRTLSIVRALLWRLHYVSFPLSNLSITTPFLGGTNLLKLTFASLNIRAASSSIL
jgi:hypothetical protein